MSHTMKLWEMVIERRLRKKTRVTDNQLSFMSGRSTMEVIYFWFYEDRIFFFSLKKRIFFRGKIEL